MTHMSSAFDASISRRRVRVGSTAGPDGAAIELDVLEAGAANGGTPVILCHGFPEAAYSWRHQLPALARAGHHVLAPDQRGYGRSYRPTAVTDYGIDALCSDLIGLLDTTGQEQAVFVGHDWGALIVWELAKLFPERVKAVVGVSVPFVMWPGRPTDLMRMLYGDRFFYMLYFQQVGPAERELEADVRHTMSTVLWGASGPGFRRPEGTLPPMEGTGFLTMMPTAPALPFDGPEGPWLTAADLDVYTDLFTASGFFGPVSYYRNLDANFERVKDLPADRVSMPSWFIGGVADPVLVMDPTGVERMQKQLPDFRGHVLIPGAGHWTQQEAPRQFNDALRGFLATLD
jgi:pimeloyl-ACP methyl ester carboxylesterase